MVFGWRDGRLAPIRQGGPETLFPSLPMNQKRNRNNQGQPLDEERLKGKLLCSINSGRAPADADYHKHKRGPQEPVQTENQQKLRIG